MRAIAKAKGIEWKDVALVSIKRLMQPLAREFPETKARHRGHYFRLRGLNGMRDCRMLVVIGAPCVSDWELAKRAVVLDGGNRDPRDFLPQERKRKFRVLKAASGEAHEVLAPEWEAPEMGLAWDVVVTSEVMQAIGRARPHEPRAERQLVLAYTNVPLPPNAVTRTATREEYLRELGLGRRGAEAPPTLRIEQAMRRLAAKGAFGYEDLAREAGVAEAALKRNAGYREVTRLARQALGLGFRQGGDGRKGAFMPQGAGSGS